MPRSDDEGEGVSKKGSKSGGEDTWHVKEMKKAMVVKIKILDFVFEHILLDHHQYRHQ